MMFINLITSATIACSSCNTSIKFSINSGSDEIQAIKSAVSILKCPKCKMDLSREAKEVIDAVYSYNEVARRLINIQRTTDTVVN